MSLNLYAITVPPFLHGLKTLSALLKKGEIWANDQDRDHSDLLNARLIADMEDLIYQVQRVSDVSKNAVIRVADIEPVSLADNEKTFAELYARIDNTIEILEKVEPTAFEGKENKEVILKPRSQEYKFTGTSYLLQFAIPNFYFHQSIAYALLRKMGVPIGKLDFLGVGIRQVD